ncbi:hypothetical protein ABK040_011375 [Willaertia magna]
MKKSLNLKSKVEEFLQFHAQQQEEEENHKKRKKECNNEVINNKVLLTSEEDNNNPNNITITIYEEEREEKDLKKRKIQSKENFEKQATNNNNNNSIPTTSNTLTNLNNTDNTNNLTPLQKKQKRIEKQLNIFGPNTKPSLSFQLTQNKKNFFTINDLQNLMIYSLIGYTSGLPNQPTKDLTIFQPKWIQIQYLSMIDKVIFLHFDSISLDLFENYKSTLLNYFNQFMSPYIEKSVSSSSSKNKGRSSLKKKGTSVSSPYGITSSKCYLTLNPPWSAEQANLNLITEKRNANYWKKCFLHRLFKRTVSFVKESKQEVKRKRITANTNTMSGTLKLLQQMSEVKSEKKVTTSINNEVKKEEVIVKQINENESGISLGNGESSNNTSSLDKDNSSVMNEGNTISSESTVVEKEEEIVQKTTIEDLLLTHDQLCENNYPVLAKEGYVVTKPISENKYKLLAVDCEMCLTSKGDELTRVTVVNENLEVIYDELVKPYNEIVDYKTEYSGITKEMLLPIEKRLEQVQQDLLELISSETILIGHSLENDLIALKMVHTKVVDTALLFQTATFHKQSLKSLTRRYLYRDIQTCSTKGHDSSEDAIAALELVKFTLDNGIETVLKRERRSVENINNMENVFEFLNKIEKKCVFIDRPNNINHIVSNNCSLTDPLPCMTDEEVFQKAKKQVNRIENDLVFCHFSELGIYYEQHDVSQSKKNNGQKDQQTSTIESILKRYNNYLKEIYEQASNNSLFIISSGHGNISQIERLFKNQKDWKDLKQNELEIRQSIQHCLGVCFVGIK